MVTLWDENARQEAELRIGPDTTTAIAVNACVAMPSVAFPAGIFLGGAENGFASSDQRIVLHM
jgi:hypothetical protein